MDLPMLEKTGTTPVSPRLVRSSSHSKRSMDSTSLTGSLIYYFAYIRFSFTFSCCSGGYYYLRPEVIESNFYAWRATGDVKYLANASKALDGILKYCKAPLAYAGIGDVMKTDSVRAYLEVCLRV